MYIITVILILLGQNLLTSCYGRYSVTRDTRKLFGIYNICSCRWTEKYPNKDYKRNKSQIWHWEEYTQKLQGSFLSGTDRRWSYSFFMSKKIYKWYIISAWDRQHSPPPNTGRIAPIWSLGMLSRSEISVSVEFLISKAYILPTEHRGLLVKWATNINHPTPTLKLE